MPPPVSVSASIPAGAHGSGLIIAHWICGPPADQHPLQAKDPSLLLHPRWSTQVKAVIAAVGMVKDVGFVQGWGAGGGASSSFAVTFRATQPDMVPAFLAAFQELKRRLHRASAIANYERGNYAAQLDPFRVLENDKKDGVTAGAPSPLPQSLTLDSFGIIDETVASNMKRMRVGLPSGVAVGGKRGRDDDGGSGEAASSSSTLLTASSSGAIDAQPPVVNRFPYLPPTKATSMISLVIEDIHSSPPSTTAHTITPSPSWSATAAARGILTRYLGPMAEAMGRIPNRSILDVLEGQTVPGERGAANLGELFHLKYICTPHEQMQVLDRYQMAAAALCERIFFFVAPPRVAGAAARLFLLLPPDFPGSEQLLSVIKQQLESTFAVLARKPVDHDDGLQVGDGVLPATAYRRARVHTISILQFFTALQKV